MKSKSSEIWCTCTCAIFCWFTATPSHSVSICCQIANVHLFIWSARGYILYVTLKLCHTFMFMKIKWLPQFQYTVAAIRPHPIYQLSGLNVSKRAYNINLNCEYIGLALFLFLFFSARIFIIKVHLFTVFVLTQLLFLSDDLKARLSAIQCFYSTIFIAYSYYMAVALDRIFFAPCVIFCVWFELVHYFIVFSNKSVSFHLLYLHYSITIFRFIYHQYFHN